MDDHRPRSPFLAQDRDALRALNYSLRTEQAYLFWVCRFIRVHRLRHPREMGATEVASVLSDLAVRRNVAPNTQAHALNALVFLYRHVLQRPLREIPGIQRARKKPRLPVVLSTEVVGRVLAALEGVHRIVACLLYGSGLRLPLKRGARAVLSPPGAALGCTGPGGARRVAGEGTAPRMAR